MIESTQSFATALNTVYRKRAQEGILTNDDRRYIGYVLSHPVAYNQRGRQVYPLRVLHGRVRTMYYRQNSLPWDAPIDWTSIVKWIEDHWVDILSAAASILEILIILIPLL